MILRRRAASPHRFALALAGPSLLAALAVAAGLATFRAAAAPEAASPAAELPNGGCDKTFHRERLLWSYPDDYGQIVAEEPEDLPIRAPNRIIAGCFAWQSFMALSHPLRGGGGPVRDGGGRPTRWETWDNVHGELFGELFAGDGDGSCRGAPRRRRSREVLSMATGLSAPIRDEVDAAGNQCLDLPVFDRAGHRVWRQVLVDPVFAGGLPATDPPPPGFELPPGATSLKAAWKVFDPRTDDRERYFVRPFRIDDGTTCVRREMALVGLHLVRKTSHYPGWIWMSFEHVANAPTRGTDELEEGGWTFFDADASTPWNSECRQAGGTPCPSQVVRLAPIHQDSREVSRYWWSLLPADSVWRHYVLVGTQWSQEGPDIPGPEKRVVGNPELANAVMEMACQDPSAHPRGCIGCHGSADAVDMSFVPRHVD